MKRLTVRLSIVGAVLALGGAAIAHSVLSRGKAEAPEGDSGPPTVAIAARQNLPRRSPPTNVRRLHRLSRCSHHRHPHFHIRNRCERFLTRTGRSGGRLTSGGRWRRVRSHCRSHSYAGPERSPTFRLLRVFPGVGRQFAGRWTMTMRTRRQMPTAAATRGVGRFCTGRSAGVYDRCRRARCSRIWRGPRRRVAPVIQRFPVLGNRRPTTPPSPRLLRPLDFRGTTAWWTPAARCRLAAVPGPLPTTDALERHDHKPCLVPTRCTRRGSLWGGDTEQC